MAKSIYNPEVNPETIARRHVKVIDSHTAGEPTRVIIAGGPELGRGNLRQRLEMLRTRHDDLRTGTLLEPRGSEVIVGALLCEPAESSAVAAVIFYNDVGYLGMCGHGTIGVITTLAYLGRIKPGRHLLETPVGVVSTELHEDGTVSFSNVMSYRYRESVAIETRGYGRFVGDIAWGGNWFFLVAEHGLALTSRNTKELTAVTMAIRKTLQDEGVTGRGGALIDHVELFGAPADPANDSRNFVLCPGAAFDRSPCGTGTSAKLACLYAAGKLRPGVRWRQEGILGNVFEGSVQPAEEAGIEGVIPTISGRAWITAEATLIFDSTDPLGAGVCFS